MMSLGPKKLVAYLLLPLISAVTFHFSCASKKQASYEARKGIKINELTELKVDDSGDSTEVVITAKDELTPNVFKLTDPLRVIIDLTDTTLGEVKGPITVNNGVVNDITTSQFDDATSSLSRVVIGFDKSVDYKVNPQNNTLTVTVPKAVAATEGVGEEQMAASESFTPQLAPEGEALEQEIPELPEPALDEELPELPEEGAPEFASEGPEMSSEATEPVEEFPIVEAPLEEVPLVEEAPIQEVPIESVAPVGEIKTAKKIEDIQFETSDMGTSLYVTVDGDIGEWNDFVIENPTRLVIDLNGIKNDFSGKKKINIGSSEVERLRIGEYKDKTRLVIDYPAAKKPSYTINKEDKRLVVSIFSEVGDAPPAADKFAQEELPIEDFDAPVVPAEELPSIEEPPAEEVAEVAPEELDVGGPELPVVEDDIPEIGAGEEDFFEEAPAVVQEPVSPKATVTSLDFQQLKDTGKSRIAIGATAPANFTTREVSPGTIVVEMNNTFIPNTNLRRFVDTSSFKSAVTKITPKYDGSTNTASFAINLREQVSYNAYQEGNTLYVDFDIPGSMMASAQAPREEAVSEPVAEPDLEESAPAEEEIAEETFEEEPVDNQRWAPVKEEFLSDRMESSMPLSSMGQVLAETYGGKRRFVGRRISLDFKNAELRSIFRLLAEVSKFNMIIGDDVSGRITVRLENVPWDQAFAIILQTKGLWFERYGNIVRIAPAEKLRKEREAAVASRRAEIEAKPLDVLFKPISYATAADIAQRVRPVLSGRGAVDIDTRTNTLIIRDVKEFLEAAKSLIEKLDTQTPQVSIESRIVEADTSLRKGLGVRWGGNIRFSPASGNPTGLFFPNSVNISNIALNYPILNPNATAGISLGSLNNVVDLSLILELAEQRGRSKLISSPKVTVLDNATATIMAGTKIPFITQTSSSGSNVRFENAVISLSVTPHITADGAVFMKISATRNEPDFDNLVQQNPTIVQRSINTEVLVKSGNTTVLGGIYKITKGSGYEGLPILSKIPILGYLFRNWSKQVIREELLIFITPKIVGDERAAVRGEFKN